LFRSTARMAILGSGDARYRSAMTDLPGRRPPPIPDHAPGLRERLENLRHLGRLLAQIWRTSKRLTAASIGLRLISALQPIAMLYVGKLIIDEVIRLTGIDPPGP